MPYWPAQITDPVLLRMGPFLDGICGTDGATSDLKTAIATNGWKRVLVTNGATCSGSFSITNPDTWIYATGGIRGFDLGAYTITISASRVYIRGIRLSSPTGVGFLISGSASETFLDLVTVMSGASHGIQYTTSGNDHIANGVWVQGNAGDGIKIQSGPSGVKVVGGGMIYNNTGYGVNDSAGGKALISGNRIAANTAGNINAGTNTVHSNLNQLL